jgi:hypothetical protein
MATWQALHVLWSHSPDFTGEAVQPAIRESDQPGSPHIFTLKFTSKDGGIQLDHGQEGATLLQAAHGQAGALHHEASLLLCHGYPVLQ